VAIKAHRALRDKPTKQQSANAPTQRQLEPVTIGMIGEVAVKLALKGVPRAVAMQQIIRAVPIVNFNETLQQIAAESLRGAEKVREKLAEEYGTINIIGRGEGRHPDLAGKVRPDFVALRNGNQTPLIVEVKDTTRMNAPDHFQATYYNGIAAKYGLYLIEERLEGDVRLFSPQILHGAAEALLIYPRLAKYSIVKENFVPEEETIKEIWKAKELGFKGQVPETTCGRKCPHNRLKVKLPEGNMEPLTPAPLVLSRGVLESGFDLDVGYQVSYAWNLLPMKIKLAIVMSAVSAVNGLTEMKEWLTQVVGLDEEPAEIVSNPLKRQEFLRTKPQAEDLVKSMANDTEPWKIILGKRLEVNAPSILALGTAIYSLPRRSSKFVKDAWGRWH
jgi:hypothetical protein